MSRPAWTGTTTVRPSGWRITRWLPLILTTVKPARSSALTTFTPGTAGKDSSIRRRLGSASAHPEDRPRRAMLPARPAGRQPRLPPSDRRPPPPRPSAACGGTPNAVFVLFYDVRQMDYAGHNTDSPIPGAQHRSAPGRTRPAASSPMRSRGLVCGRAACPTGPTPSTTCHRRYPRNGDGQGTNTGHIRLLEGIELDNHRSEGVQASEYVATIPLPAGCLRDPTCTASKLIAWRLTRR